MPGQYNGFRTATEMRRHQKALNTPLVAGTPRPPMVRYDSHAFKMTSSRKALEARKDCGLTRYDLFLRTRGTALYVRVTPSQMMLFDNWVAWTGRSAQQALDEAFKGLNAALDKPLPKIVIDKDGNTVQLEPELDVDLPHKQPKRSKRPSTTPYSAGLHYVAVGREAKKIRNRHNLRVKQLFVLDNDYAIDEEGQTYYVLIDSELMEYQAWVLWTKGDTEPKKGVKRPRAVPAKPPVPVKRSPRHNEEVLEIEDLVKNGKFSISPDGAAYMATALKAIRGYAPMVSTKRQSATVALRASLDYTLAYLSNPELIAIIKDKAHPAHAGKPYFDSFKDEETNVSLRYVDDRMYDTILKDKKLKLKTAWPEARSYDFVPRLIDAWDTTRSNYPLTTFKKMFAGLYNTNLFAAYHRWYRVHHVVGMEVPLEALDKIYFEAKAHTEYQILSMLRVGHAWVQVRKGGVFVAYAAKGTSDNVRMGGHSDISSRPGMRDMAQSAMGWLSFAAHRNVSNEWERAPLTVESFSHSWLDIVNSNTEFNAADNLYFAAPGIVACYSGDEVPSKVAGYKLTTMDMASPGSVLDYLRITYRRNSHSRVYLEKSPEKLVYLLRGRTTGPYADPGDESHEEFEQHLVSHMIPGKDIVISRSLEKIYRSTLPFLGLSNNILAYDGSYYPDTVTRGKLEAADTSVRRATRRLRTTEEDIVDEEDDEDDEESPSYKRVKNSSVNSKLVALIETIDPMLGQYPELVTIQKLLKSSLSDGSDTALVLLGVNMEGIDFEDRGRAYWEGKATDPKFPWKVIVVDTPKGLNYRHARNPLAATPDYGVMFGWPKFSGTPLMWVASGTLPGVVNTDIETIDQALLKASGKTEPTRQQQEIFWLQAVAATTISTAKNLAANYATMLDYKTRLIQVQSEINTTVRHLNSDMSTVYDSVRKSVDDMALNPDVEKVEFRRDALVVTTHDIWVRDIHAKFLTGEKRYLGKFEISIKFLESAAMKFELKARNIASPLVDDDSNIHPHHGCTGTYDAMFRDCCYRFDLSALASNVVAFLSSYDSEEGGRTANFLKLPKIKPEKTAVQSYNWRLA